MNFRFIVSLLKNRFLEEVIIELIAVREADDIWHDFKPILNQQRIQNENILNIYYICLYSDCPNAVRYIYDIYI